MLGFLVPLVAPRMLRAWRRHESELGYRLQVEDPPEGWLPGQMIFDLTDTWRAAGMAVHGMHYFTLGRPENGRTVRFQEDHDLYQAWLGGYIVRFEDSGDRSPRDYLELSEQDQKMWLRSFGDPVPIMDFDEVTEAREVALNGRRGLVYHWQGTTHNDIGKGARRFSNRVAMDGMAYFGNLLNPDFRLKGKNFIPDRPRPGTPPYAETKLFGCGAVIELEPKLRAVLYACKTMADPRLEDLLSHVVVRKV